MNENAFSLVQEFTSRYVVRENEDGSVTITIDVPKAYKELWMIKLSDLSVTQEELATFG
jgi:hypothetical protein